MRDEAAASPSLRDLKEAGLGAVEDWLSTLPGSARELDQGELRSYEPRGATHGWRLDVRFSDGVTRRLDLLADRVFPRTPLRVILVDRPPFLTWPHVEQDGALCLLPEGATAMVSEPGTAAEYIVRRACDLLEECIAGTNVEDLRAEFCSYWQWARTKDDPLMWSLLRPEGPTRPIRVWRAQKRVLVGENDASLMAWLRSALTSDEPQKPEPALLLWLDRPLVPSEYPKKGEDVVALARRAGGDAVAALEGLTAPSPKAALVIIGAKSPNGPCLAAVSLSPRADQTVKSMRRGFRPGRVPSKIASGRYVAGAAITRSVVDRADPAWVHGRGEDPRFTRLRESKVVVLGCGSIGAPVAVQLAAAGVGRFALVDPDELQWANVGRHPLGAESVGDKKVIALAKRIRTSFPHIEVEPYSKRWEDLPGDLGDARMQGDIIVSTTGNWPSDAMLNGWHAARGKTPSVVYGWTEAYACAGHAVAITGTGGCLECGFDDSGTPRLRVCNWPRDTVLQEPACGAVFQPYGPIELGRVVATIAELALDCLLATVTTSTHRIWVDRRSRLTETGGSWTPEWEDVAGERHAAAFLHESSWTSSANCRTCQLAPSV